MNTTCLSPLFPYPFSSFPRKRESTPSQLCKSYGEKPPRYPFRIAAVLIAALSLALILACSQSTQSVPEPAALESENAAPPEEIPLIKGPVSEDGLQAIFATPDIAPGRHRIAFALTSQTGLVKALSATVQSFHDPQEDSFGEPEQTALSLFHPFPLVERGLYVTNLTFDRPGKWAIQATVLGDDGLPKRAALLFDVPEKTHAPSVGTPAIPSRSKTTHDVERLSQLTTGSLQDEDLYQTSIADAIQSGLPTVIVMASPAFCINAVCGPQVEVLRDLKNEFPDQANFIHVDYYDNPEQIQGDLNRAVLSPVVREWRLPSAEWSFVINRDGIITGRFEGFTPLQELRQALKKVL